METIIINYRKIIRARLIPSCPNEDVVFYKRKWWRGEYWKDFLAGKKYKTLPKEMYESCGVIYNKPKVFMELEDRLYQTTIFETDKEAEQFLEEIREKWNQKN